MNGDLVIALDAMGGDAGPAAVVAGAAQALAADGAMRFRMFGDEAQLLPLLAAHPALHARTDVLHTTEVVEAHVRPSTALRRARHSSMRLAIVDVREGNAHCIVSGGNTGALMAIAKAVCGTLPGITRPAIGSIYPHMNGMGVLLDMGANVECTGRNLFEFAIMGDAFARAVLKLDKPRLALLNVGSEEMKGDTIVQDAARRIREHATHLNFVGFAEGDNMFYGVVDVVVTDGFTGNVTIKAMEGMARLLASGLKDAIRSSWPARIGYLFARGALLRLLRNRFNPARYNGAMFLGLDGIVVKSHGGADAAGVTNAIQVAADLVRRRINERIRAEMCATGADQPETEQAAVQPESTPAQVPPAAVSSAPQPSVPVPPAAPVLPPASAPAAAAYGAAFIGPKPAVS